MYRFSLEIYFQNNSSVLDPCNWKTEIEIPKSASTPSFWFRSSLRTSLTPAAIYSLHFKGAAFMKFECEFTLAYNI